MTPERWAMVERLYHAALQRDASERDRFVAEACAGNDALRREVVSLLDHDGSAAFLSTPAAVQADHVLPSGGVSHLRPDVSNVAHRLVERGQRRQSARAPEWSPRAVS